MLGLVLIQAFQLWIRPEEDKLLLGKIKKEMLLFRKSRK